MLTPPPEIDAFYLSMNNPDEPLGRVSDHPFELEGVTWPTAEHYYRAMRFERFDDREAVRQAPTVEEAIKRGKRWFKKTRRDWKAVQSTVMTRALYIQCRTYPEIAERLLQTGDKPIIEDSQYDYLWGLGRDKRGGNLYGKVLMNVRDKLREEAGQA